MITRLLNGAVHMKKKILVIDDDLKLNRLLVDYLARFGFETVTSPHPEDGLKSLKKIKPDRMPIGIHYRSDTPFSKQRLELHDKDVLYIFSDGYADQFGGLKGGKLKYKPFQDLFLTHHQKPMKEQKEHLEEFLNNWQGDLEQVDDILVIGFRV